MKRSSKKKKSTRGGPQMSPPLDPLRRGMPAADSIIGVKEMKRSGKVFRIIKTTEIDEYEQKSTKGLTKHRR
jgi:hypothetical protein